MNKDTDIKGNTSSVSQNKSTGSHSSNFKFELRLTNLNWRKVKLDAENLVLEYIFKKI